MNSTILKSLLLTFVILLNVHAFNARIPTEPLLKMHLTLAIAILVVIFILKNNMANLLFLWFLLVMFQSSGGSIDFPMLPAISLHRIVLGLIGVIFIVEMIMQQRRALSFSAVEMAMMFFSMYIIFSMIVAGTITEKGKGLALGTFIPAYGIPFVIFFISKNTIDDETKIKKFFFLLTVIGLYLGITAILGYFQFLPRYFGGGDIRAGGPFLQPAVNGTVMGMLLFVEIFLLLHENKRWKKYLHVIPIICLPVGILFTMTRSAWLAILVAIFTIPVLIPRVRKTFFISLLIVGFLSLLFVNFFEIKIRKFATEGEFITKEATLIERIVNRTMSKSSVEDRKELYKTSYTMFFDKPFFGHGYGAFQQARKAYGIKIQLLYRSTVRTRGGTVHDTLVALLMDSGLIGVGLYLFIVVYILNVGRKLYVKLPRDTYLGKDLIAACIGIFMVFLINAQMFDMRVFIFPNSLFFCIAGIAVGLNQRILRNEIKLSTGDTA